MFTIKHQFFDLGRKGICAYFSTMSSGVLVNSNIAKVELNGRVYAVLYSVLHGVAFAIFVYLSSFCGCSDFFFYELGCSAISVFHII